MKYKKQLIRIISVLLVIVLTIGMLSYMSKLCQREYSQYTYGEFFEADEQFDVLILGSSKVINDLFPMRLWKNYGITSFDFGSHASLLPSTYWLFMNSLRYKTPNIVVIDAYGINSDYKYSTPEFLHNWMDVFGLSITKVRAAYDLYNDKAKDEAIRNGEVASSSKGTFGEFLWDFCKYHSRWNSLYEMNFNVESSTEKGAEARINIMPLSKEADRNIDASQTDSVGCVYLRKIIEECLDRNIEVIVTYLPSERTADNYEQDKMACDIAREYGVAYIDYIDNDNIDYSTDFYDKEHLNPMGAVKATDILGEYIINHSNRINDKSEAECSKWDDDYVRYVAYKNILLQSAKTPQEIMMFAQDSDYDSVLVINDMSVLEDDISFALLGKMKNADMTVIRSRIESDGKCIMNISDGMITGFAECEPDASEYEGSGDEGQGINIILYRRDSYNNEKICKGL